MEHHSQEQKKPTWLHGILMLCGLLFVIFLISSIYTIGVKEGSNEKTHAIIDTEVLDAYCKNYKADLKSSPRKTGYSLGSALEKDGELYALTYSENGEPFKKPGLKVKPLQLGQKHQQQAITPRFSILNSATKLTNASNVLYTSYDQEKHELSVIMSDLEGSYGQPIWQRSLVLDDVVGNIAEDPIEYDLACGDNVHMMFVVRLLQDEGIGRKVQEKTFYGLNTQSGSVEILDVEKKVNDESDAELPF